jgi:REP element-mobilizing transposase RayT
MTALHAITASPDRELALAARFACSPPIEQLAEVRYLPTSSPSSYGRDVKPPLAYFITWTTYGTWLHGDRRGWVDRGHNILGDPRCEPDEEIEIFERESLGSKPIRLGAGRVVVEEAIRDHCRVRRWVLLAVNARTNHVHVVVEAPGVTPEEVMRQLKCWATRRLRERWSSLRDRRLWTRHGSTRYINRQDELESKVDYVERLQDLRQPPVR